MRQEPKVSVRRKPVTTALLAAACAGMLSPAARATPFVETTDFGNSFGTRTTAPAGTNFVQGTLTGGTDFNDYVRITGLPPGPLSVSWTMLTTVTTDFDIIVYNDAQATLGNASLHGITPANGLVSGTIPLTVPADGVLVPNISMEAGSGVVSYTVAVPEPSSAAALAGLGALALLGRRKPKASTDEMAGQT
jgi:hypothetical protein